MSSRCKPKPVCFRSDIHRLLQAAEAGQKADILTYSSGHLGPRGPNQSRAPGETKPSFWRTSRRKEETPNPLTPQQTRPKKKETKQCPSEFSPGTALVERDVSRSTRDRATDCSSHADKREGINQPKVVRRFSKSLPLQPRSSSQKESNSSPDPGVRRHSDRTVPNHEGQLKIRPGFGKRVAAGQDLWAGRNVAEKHERKLQKELSRMSAQSWPSRDRLAVFSDVFDDVCEGSPVFGRILREIKTEYDLYVNHLMASQSFLHSTSLDTSLKGRGDEKVRRTELGDAEEEVCRLEKEARGALEENQRVRNESQNVPALVGPEDRDIKNASLSGPQRSGTAVGPGNGVQSKRLQVLNMWREIQQLEEELKEKPVSSATVTATERCIRDLKTERMRLIASNDRLKTTNKDLENNINMILNREKASKAIRRMLWDEVRCDLQTESE